MNKQLAGLRRELKDFAFEQSPSFRDGHTAGIEVIKRFYCDNEPPLPEVLSGRIEPDLVTVQMGFKAIRLSEKNGGKPAYVFTLTSEVNQTISSRLLPQDVIDELVFESANEGEDDAGLMVLDYDRREAVHDDIAAAGVECLRYKEVSLEMSDFEGNLEEIYTQGYMVDGDVKEELSTSDTILDIFRQAITDFPLRERIDDANMVRLQFFDVIDSSGIRDRDELDLMPLEDKRALCRFIMHSLRSGTLM